MKMKRIVSFLITFAMLFTMMPNIAFAGENESLSYAASRVADISQNEENQSSNKQTVAAAIWKDAENDDLFYLAVAAAKQQIQGVDGKVWEIYPEDKELVIRVNNEKQFSKKPSELGQKKNTTYWLIAELTREDFNKLQQEGNDYSFQLEGLPGGFELQSIIIPGDFVEEEILKPTFEDIKDLLVVEVDCETDRMNHQDRSYSGSQYADLFKSEYFEIGNMPDGNRWPVTLTEAGVQAFIEKYNDEVKVEGGHTIKASDNAAYTVYVKKDGETWSVAEDDDEFEIDVVCTLPTLSPKLEVVKKLTKVTRDDEDLDPLPDEVQVGDTLTYTITVKNTGSAKATGVSVEEALTVDGEPREVTWPEDSNDDTSFELQQNDEKKFTVTYTVQEADAGKTLFNVATAKVDNDEAPSNLVKTTVAPQYAIEKTVVDENGTSVDTIHTIYQVGDLVYYKITVGSINTWPTGETVKVFDQLPAGLKLVSAEALDKSVTILSQENNTVVAEANAPGSILVTAEVLASYDAEYDNIASVDDGDPNTKDDPKTGPVPIKIAALDVQKTLMDNGKVYNVGDTVKYQITFKNIGNVALKQFDITDVVPAGLEIVDSAWENGKFIGQLADELKPGEQKTVVVDAKITDRKDSYSNTATVAAEVAVDGRPVTKDATNTDLKVKPNDIKPDHNVKVQYVLEDKDGEVTPIDKPTLPATHGAPWQVKVSDSESLTDVNNLVVARAVKNNDKHYVFKEFRNDELSGTVTKDVQIVAVYGLDEIGGGTDQKQPDGIPDEYQATVTYRVVNGTWSDGTELDRTEVFDLYSFDDVAAKWVQIPNVTLGSNTIPTGMLADANYVGQRGAWNEDITSETAVTGDVTYIYRFGDAAANQIIVNYRSNNENYGTVSVPQQVFTKDDWTPFADDSEPVKINLTATAKDNGGRTYFNEWQGSLVDNLGRNITENKELNVEVTAKIGQTYTIIADFGRNSGGGAHHPDARDDDDDDNDRDDEDDTEESIDEEVPLAETLWLNTEDHYAYIVGYSEDGTVRPNANISRAEVATIFFRLLTDEARDQFWMTSNNFSDVLPNDWYNNAVSTMVNMGIIQGYEDGTFRPNANITRAEFAAIAARFMASGYGVEDDLFTDIANHWARESINDAAMAGWINGYEDGTFRPDAAITRAEAVTLVNNVLQRKPDADHMFDSMIKWPDSPESAWYYEAIQEATNSHDYDLFEDAEYETWTALQENRDWAALEKDWVNTHRTGGEVA